MMSFSPSSSLYPPKYLKTASLILVEKWEDLWTSRWQGWLIQTYIGGGVGGGEEYLFAISFNGYRGRRGKLKMRFLILITHRNEIFLSNYFSVPCYVNYFLILKQLVFPINLRWYFPWENQKYLCRLNFDTKEKW